MTTRNLYIALLLFELIFALVTEEGLKRPGLVGSVIGIGIAYFCVLRKPGTKWLTFTIFCKSVALVGSGYLLVHPQIIARAAIPHFLALTIASTIITLLILYFAIRMRQLNTELQVSYIAIADPELFPSWGGAKTKDELEEKFEMAMNKFPKYESGLSREYKKRKKAL